MEDAMNEVTRILEAVIGHLNLIEVKGQTNLAILYNSIDALTNLKRGIEDSTKKTEEAHLNVESPSEKDPAK
ncbi:MAG: hypothetical protein EOM36_06175 [Bacteroidia bacterium]|nr:hypothetical protein [Bacteroidia bacterium]